LVQELGLDVTPAHAALDDARATAMVFRALIARARETLGWTTVGDVLAALRDRWWTGPRLVEERQLQVGLRVLQPGQPNPISRTGRDSTCDFSSAERAARKIVSTSSVGSSGSPGGSPG